MKILKFLRHYGPYNPGEFAGKNDAEAEALIKAKVAVEYVAPVVDSAAVDPALAPAVDAVVATTDETPAPGTTDVSNESASADSEPVVPPVAPPAVDPPVTPRARGSR